MFTRRPLIIICPLLIILSDLYELFLNLFFRVPCPERKMEPLNDHFVARPFVRLSLNTPFLRNVWKYRAGIYIKYSNLWSFGSVKIIKFQNQPHQKIQ